MRPSLLGLALPALASLTSASPAPPRGNKGLAPIWTPPAPPSKDGSVGIQSGKGDEASHIVKDSYIVVFKDGVQEQQMVKHKQEVHEMHTREAARLQKRGLDFGSLFKGLKHHYSLAGTKNAFRGYSAHISESLLDHIRALPEVEYVERDSIVTINDPFWNKAQSTAKTVPVSSNAEEGVASSEIDTEYGAPWGLARISHRNRLRFGTFNVYPYEHDGGEGVDVYVVDTGVRIDHLELQGRASWGKTIPDAEDIDDNGHGSHCAGTIASRAYGVAKKANIIAVKVLGAGGSGTMSDVLAGVTWAAEAAEKKAEVEAKKSDSKHKGSVANMSLGGGKSPSLDKAVDAAVDTGLHFAVAAGNDNRDACTFSPAASANAITVGASTIADEKAYFSNHGKCVDIFAPGLNIKSIWNTGNQSVNTISGTSMASPHIAGLAAYFVSLYPDKLDFSSVAEAESDSLRSSFAWTSISGQLVFDRLRQAVGFGSSRQTAVAPIPKKLTPKALKKFMISLSSKGVLDGLPAETVNLLAFNNATSS